MEKLKAVSATNEATRDIANAGSTPGALESAIKLHKDATAKAEKKAKEASEAAAKAKSKV